MIEKALLFLKAQVNNFIELKTGVDSSLTLTNITDNDGKTIVSDLGMSLINIEEEKIGKVQSPYTKTAENKFVKVNPEIHINLFVMFSANFGTKEDKYRESLKFISFVISFFQSKNVFTHANSPELDQNIDRMIVELFPLGFEQQNYVWGSIGSKYMPSVLYKIRMLALQEMDIVSEVHEITTANINEKE